MSQKKVDYYKQAKANRKREEKKKNLRKAFDYTILGLIALAIVVWIGWSALYKHFFEFIHSEKSPINHIFPHFSFILW